MTRKQLIQEIITGGFEQFDQEGLINYTSLNRWIRLQLLRFGTNIMLRNEKTIEVINGKAKLPENFFELDLALRVDLDRIIVQGEKEDFLQSALLYKERTEVDVEWDNGSDSFWNKDYKCIEEKFYLKRCTATACYVNPSFLRLTKGFNKEKASSKCHSLSKKYAPSSIYEINIVGDYINTNFDEGYIYIQYSGLETAEDGDLVIPKANHDKISEYIISYCRMRIIEDLVMGGDEPNLIKMLEYYSAKSQRDFSLALTDAKFYGARGWRKGAKKSIKRNSLIYESMLPGI